jgi:hypothetical protein
LAQEEEYCGKVISYKKVIILIIIATIIIIYFIEMKPSVRVFMYGNVVIIQPVDHRSAVSRRGRDGLLSSVSWQLREKARNLCDHKLIPTNQPATPKHSFSANVTLCFHTSPPALV